MGYRSCRYNNHNFWVKVTTYFLLCVCIRNMSTVAATVPQCTVGPKILLTKALPKWFPAFNGVKRLNIFSDSCGGQNKNSTVIQYLYSLVRNRRFHCIRHVFPVRGHSFLPCDRDFAKTNAKKRKVDSAAMDGYLTFCKEKKPV